MTVEQIDAEVVATKRALFDLRLKRATRQEYKSSNFKFNKKKVSHPPPPTRLTDHMLVCRQPYLDEHVRFGSESPARSTGIAWRFDWRRECASCALAHEDDGRVD
jgi:ribosomal protein L29